MLTNDQIVQLIQADARQQAPTATTAAKIGGDWTAARVSSWKFRLKITETTEVSTYPARRLPVFITEEQRQAGLERILAGEPVEEVCRSLGVSRTFYAATLKAAGVKAKNKQEDRRYVWTPEMDQVVVDGFRAGLPDRDIAIQLGRKASDINQRIIRLKLRETETRGSLAPKVDPVTSRRCTRCREVKPLDGYSYDRINQRTYATCIACRNQAHVQRCHGTSVIPDQPCAICRQEGEVVDHRHAPGGPVVDHRHAPGGPTGYAHCPTLTRGILCHRCNTGIGKFQDSPERLEQAARYARLPGLGRFLPTVAPVAADLMADKQEQHLHYTYGLTGQDFSALVADQGGRCKICEGTLNLEDRRAADGAVVDHDHVTGEIRGVLHSGCNMGFGDFQGSAEILLRAAEYLRDPPGLKGQGSSARSQELQQVIDGFLAGYPEAAVVEGPSGVSARDLGKVVIAIINPEIHNQETLANLGVRREDFRNHLVSWVKATETELAKRVVLALPDGLTPGLTSSLNHAMDRNREIIGARQTECRPVPKQAAQQFLELHHIQGSCTSHTYLGLFQGDRLVALMAFGNPRHVRSFKHDIHLQRFCVASGLSCPGAASKLLAEFRRTNGGSIVSFSDPSYADGGLYRSLGFTDEGLSSDIDYRYWKDGRSYGKASKQRDQLLCEAAQAGLEVPAGQAATEQLLAGWLGYLRVYLPGKHKWTLPALPLAPSQDPTRIPA